MSSDYTAAQMHQEAQHEVLAVCPKCLFKTSSMSCSHEVYLITTPV